MSCTLALRGMFPETNKANCIARNPSDHEITQHLLTGNAGPMFISWCSIREAPDLVADGWASNYDVEEGSAGRHILFDFDVN